MSGHQSKGLPDQEELHRLLRYDQTTGQLFWRARKPEMFAATPNRSTEHACAQWNSRFAAKEALTKTNVGYRCGRLNYQYVLAHRVIWKMMTGAEAEEIDHIDGNRSNNSWSNLRSVSASINRRNAARRSDNKSGVTGVWWNAQKQKWQAAISLGGKQKHVGFFDTIEEAERNRLLRRCIRRVSR